MSEHIGHCWPEKADPHNSGSTPRIFFKFCRIEGAKKYMKVSKKIRVQEK